MLPIYYSDAFLNHDTGAFHPERPARLQSIVKALRSAPFADKLEWREPPIASLTEIQQVHSLFYIQSLAELVAAGGGHVEADTPVSSGSFRAACLAVGAWMAAGECVLQTGQPAFVLCRPPGHHAEPERGMGFCLFSNASIAALWALKQPGIERVAIFDWDVHHGNGTQAVVERYPQLAYASIHQFPLYPGTGFAHETGIHSNICNVPLPAGSDWSVYKDALHNTVLPFLQKFQPDLLLVSAGFDCAKGDPLASMLLEPEDFGRMAQLCLEQVTRKTVFGLEGGYDLNNLARSWLSLAQVCLGGEP
ncbi:MAG: histone deacetylase family protein [Cyanobacteriota bacterium]